MTAAQLDKLAVKTGTSLDADAARLALKIHDAIASKADPFQNDMAGTGTEYSLVLARVREIFHAQLNLELCSTWFLGANKKIKKKSQAAKR